MKMTRLKRTSAPITLVIVFVPGLVREPQH